MSDDGKSIRRLMPVPEYDTADMQRRIVVVENLPAMPTIGEGDGIVEKRSDRMRIIKDVTLSIDEFLPCSIFCSPKTLLYSLNDGSPNDVMTPLTPQI